MAKITIDAEVDASSFASFYAAFQEYQKHLGAQPGVWEHAAEAAAKQQQAFAATLAVLSDVANTMADVLKHTRDMENSSGRAASHWQRMTRATKSAAGSIADATTSLLKWANVAGLVAGLAGGAGLLGVDVLAHAVGRTRSAAMGTGTTYGGLQAFRTNYGRFGDADALLGRVNEAQTDVSKRLGFAGLGIGQTDWDGRDSADVGAEAIQRLKQFVDGVPEDALANRLQSSHVGDLFSLQEAQRVRRASPDEVRGVVEAIRRDRRQMEVDPKTQRQWQELSTQLTRAGGQIEKVFVTSLVALEPGLEHLSAEFASFAAKLMEKDGLLAHWLDELDDGMKWLADELDKPEFRKGVGDFFEAVKQAGADLLVFGEKIIAFARWLGVDHAEAAGSKDPNKIAGITGDGAPPQAPGDMTLAGTPRTALQSFGSRGDVQPGSYSQFSRHHGASHVLGRWWTDDRIRHAYDRLVERGMSPKGAEAAVARWAFVESPNDGPTAHNDIGGGHDGIAQWNRERWAAVGGSKSFDDQLDHYAEETRRLYKGVGGKIFDAASTDYGAATGASFMERASGYNPRTGEDDFTATTAASIPKVHAVVSRPRTTVTIQKNTGGNPVQTSAAVAVPP